MTQLLKLWSLPRPKLYVAAVIGSLSNYDDDHNDDFKKTMG